MALSRVETISGLAEIERMLKELPTKVEVNVVRGGLRAGSRIIAEEAKQNVPVATGKLRDSFRVGSKVDARTGRVTAYAKAGNKKAWYGHFIEFGTAPHEIRSKSGGALFVPGRGFVTFVMHPGARAKPFMRPAMYAAQTAAAETAAAYMRARLPRELMKAGVPPPEVPDIEVSV